MITIEERSRESMRRHLDESFKTFNKDKEHNMREWQYGYCQGFFEAMCEASLLSIFSSRLEKEDLEKAKPYLMKAISGQEEERQQAIEDIKNILTPKQPYKQQNNGKEKV